MSIYVVLPSSLESVSFLFFFGALVPSGFPASYFLFKVFPLPLLLLNDLLLNFPVFACCEFLWFLFLLFLSDWSPFLCHFCLDLKPISTDLLLLDFGFSFANLLGLTCLWLSTSRLSLFFGLQKTHTKSLKPKSPPVYYKVDQSMVRLVSVKGECASGKRPKAG